MIREYQPTDLADVMHVWATASAAAHPFLSPEFLDQERRDISTVHLPQATTLVWEMEGRVVGFLALIGIEVGGLFVAPRLQGTGIGRALLDRARASRSVLEVEVFKANVSGTAFYSKYGFNLIEEKIHQPTGLAIMRLRLVTR